jgi:dihydrofolate reductase
MDEKQGIADGHGIPWQGKIPGDVAYYRKKIQDGGIILMGYGLYKELSKPYPGGINYVASMNAKEKLRPGFEPVTDARAFLENAKGNVWNLGGAALFTSTIDLADEVYITQLNGDYKCTKFFPPFKDQFELASNSEPQTENGITYTFQIWKRVKAYA